ncbi:MAG: ribosome-binding factor A [Desulfobacterales bacterium CG2_30_60_27]|nr:MAG: ribosome-binding factor A [Desulfobacterales bacterium CG2_30_60_27]
MHANPDLAGIWEKPRRRPARVADTIKTEIALLLLRKIKDPRLTQVTITNVSVTDDLAMARVFYSVYEDAAAEEAGQGLLKATGFIRSHLAHVLSMRHVPKLLFLYDESLRRQADMERLFHEIEQEDGSKTD